MKEDHPIHSKLMPAIASTTGLFVSAPRSKLKEKGYFVSEQRFKDGDSFGLVQFNSFEILSPSDARTLDVITALVGAIGTCKELDVGDKEKFHNAAPEGFGTPLQASLSISAYKIAAQLGLSNSGTAIAQVVESIDRLSKVNVSIYRSDNYKKSTASFGILSYTAKNSGGKGNADINIVLNPYAAAAIFGGGRYTRIDLEIARKITSDPAYLLYRSIVSRLDKGKKMVFKMSTLVGFVYGASFEVGYRAMSKRESRVEESLAELKKLGWRVRRRKGRHETMFEIERTMSKFLKEFD